MAIDNKKEQERDELHRAIWAIADELRGAVDGWDFKTTHAISAFSIGGAQIEASRMVAGYEAINPDGSVTKMYAYADLLPENKHVIDMFTSVEEAAKAGYYYDPIFMG